MALRKRRAHRRAQGWRGPAPPAFAQFLSRAHPFDRSQTYVANVVKHFKWEPRGKRRIHSKPNAAEINACFRWLQPELDALHPSVLVCLGATAAQALLGKTFRVTAQSGVFVASPLARHVMATVHPSSILRAPNDDERRLQMEAFIADLGKVAKVIAAL